jgi:1-acyl-sn-glycerol-3-phosphate acyltransferase
MVKMRLKYKSRCSMKRKLLHRFFRWLFRLLTHVQVSGMEKLPPQGGYILAVNHLSRVDSVLVFAIMDRSDVTALVAKKYQRYPFFRWLINAVDGIWLDRQKPDPKALRRAWDFLRRGGVIGIAPEGTRSHTQALTRGKPGVAYLATKAEVPIVPVGVSGTERAFAELFRFRRPHLQVTFGDPFHLPPLERGRRDVSLQRNTEEIMCRIAALLPPEYRGVYADNPRLEQLLSELTQ